jgi:hypothetical protein
VNLQANIELYQRSVYGGGPGSGCNPEVGKCGRPASGEAPGEAKKPSELRSFLEDKFSKSSKDDKVRKKLIKCIDKFEEAGLDPRIFERGMTAEIDKDHRLENHFGAPGGGMWIQDERRLLLHETSREDVLRHELGHYLDHAVSESSSVDSEALRNGRQALRSEFNRAREEGAKKLGVPSLDREPRLGYKWNESLEKVKLAPSSYAMKNIREWVAESFEHYTRSPSTRARLRERSPETFKFVDDLTHARFLKSPAGVV